MIHLTSFCPRRRCLALFATTVIFAVFLGFAATNAAVAAPSSAISVLATSTASTATAATDPQSTAKHYSLLLSGMTDIITPETAQLDLQLRLQNNSGAPCKARVHVRIGTGTPVNAETLHSWMYATDATNFRLQSVHSKNIGTVAANSTKNFALSIPTDDLPLQDLQKWGPRFLELTVTKESSATEPGTAPVVARLHSFLLWDSGASLEPSQIMALLPLTITSTDWWNSYRSKDFQSFPELAAEPNQRLTDVCKTAQKLPLTLAVDPFLLDTQVSGVDYLSQLLNPDDATGAAVPAVARESFGTMLSRGVCGTRPYAYLPPADYAASHTAALPKNQGERLQQAARDTATALTQSLPDYRRRLLLWPSSGNLVAGQQYVDYATEIATWGVGSPLVLEDSSAYTTPRQPATFAADARREIVVNADTTTLGWATDPLLTTLLEAKAPAATSFAGSVSSAATPLDSPDSQPRPEFFSDTQLRQWALGYTAVLTRERPFDSRLFVAALSRNYQATPKQTTILAGLSQARWLDFPPLTKLYPDSRSTSFLNSSAANARRTQPYVTNRPPSLVSDTPWSAAQLQAYSPAQAARDLLRGDALAAAVQSTAADTSWSQGQPDLLIALNSLALSDACTTCLTARASSDSVLHPGALTPLQRLTRLVEAQPASTINLLDSQAQLPISVSNQLDKTVKVKLVLKPSDSRLQVKQSPTLTIGPRSTGQVHVPVVGIGSGDVNVQVTTQNIHGEAFSETQTIKVRVRANWESTGTWIVAGVLVGILVFGLVRRIRKGRKRD